MVQAKSIDIVEEDGWIDQYTNPIHCCNLQQHERTKNIPNTSIIKTPIAQCHIDSRTLILKFMYTQEPVINKSYHWGRIELN